MKSTQKAEAVKCGVFIYSPKDYNFWSLTSILLLKLKLDLCLSKIEPESLTLLL